MTRDWTEEYFDTKNKPDEYKKLRKQLKMAKQAMLSALIYLACMDRISETEANEQLAFNELRKCLEELEK